MEFCDCHCGQAVPIDMSETSHEDRTDTNHYDKQ